MKKALFISLALFAGLSIVRAQINLTFNPSKGTKYQYLMDMSQNIKQKVMGQEIPMTQKITTTYEMKVLDKSNSEIKTSFMFSDMLYDLSSMMMNMKYDSKNPSTNPSQVDATMAKVFDGLMGKPFNVSIAPDGSVKSVTGLSAIADEVMKNLGNDPQAQVVGQAIKQQFSDDAMKTLLEQSMKMYPGKAIKPGDTWSVNQTAGGMGMSMTVKSTYELKSVNNNTALVDVKSTIDGMDGKLSGTQTGTIEFDTKTGLPKVSNITQNVKGTVSANGMNVDMDLESKVKVTVKEIK